MVVLQILGAQPLKITITDYNLKYFKWDLSVAKNCKTQNAVRTQ
jgi:hypothetical protein